MKNLLIVTGLALSLFAATSAYAAVDVSDVRMAVMDVTHGGGNNLRVVVSGDVVTLSGYGDGLTVAQAKNTVERLDGVSQVINLATTR